MTEERVQIHKDKFTEGHHVFLDGRVVTYGELAWCEKVAELLTCGIDWVEEHGGTV